MSDATMDQRVVGELLDSIGARRPAPGGGAVAALTAALGAALAEMVVRYSGRPAADDDPAVTRLETLRGEFLRLADADAKAFAQLAELWKLQPDDERRRSEWNAAVTSAIEVPRSVMRIAVRILEDLDRLSGTTNANLRSDLGIAALLSAAAVRAAAWNVRVNIPLLTDANEAERLEAEIAGTIRDAGEMASKIEEHALLLS